MGFDMFGGFWVTVSRAVPGFPGGRHPLDLAIIGRSGLTRVPAASLPSSSHCWLGVSWRQAAIVGAGTHVAIVPDPTVVRLLSVDALASCDINVERTIEDVLPLNHSILVKWQDQGERGLLHLDTAGRQLPIDPRLLELDVFAACGDAVLIRGADRSVSAIPRHGKAMRVPVGRTVAEVADQELVTWDAGGIHCDSAASAGATPSIPVLGDTLERMMQRELNRTFAGRRISSDDPANALNRFSLTQPCIALESVALTTDAAVAVGGDSRLHLWSRGNGLYVGGIDIPLGLSRRMTVMASQQMCRAAVCADVFSPEGSWDESVIVFDWKDPL